MITQPSLIGAAAEEALRASNLISRSFIIGSYTVTGPFFILAGHATIFYGPDSVCSWADSTHVKWRYFNSSAGLTLTIAVTGTCYIATANQVIRLISAPNLTATYPVNPAWVGQSKVQMGGTSSFTTQGSMTRPTPTTARWFDFSTNGSQEFFDSTLQPCTSDIVYDLVSPIQLGMGALGAGNVSNLAIRIGTAQVGVNLPKYSYWNVTPLPHSFVGNVNIATDLNDAPPPSGGAASSMSMYFGLFSFAIPAGGSGISPNAQSWLPWGVPTTTLTTESIYQALIVGPMQSIPLTPSTGQMAAWASFYVPWISTTNLTIPGLQYGIGTFYCVETALVGSAVAKRPTYVYNTANYDFVRSSQLLTGSAVRGT
jgi:hypothetical protein